MGEDITSTAFISALINSSSLSSDRRISTQASLDHWLRTGFSAQEIENARETR